MNRMTGSFEFPIFLTMTNILYDFHSNLSAAQNAKFLHPVAVFYSFPYRPRLKAPVGDVLDNFDHASRQKAINLLKGAPIKSGFKLSLMEAEVTLQAHETDLLFLLFARAMAEQAKLAFGQPLCLVPIPASWKTSESEVDSTPEKLASLMLPSLPNGSLVSRLLRFRAPQERSNQSGTRSPSRLFEAMMVTERLPALPILLIDDVFSTGAHVQAAAAHILLAGGNLAGASVAAYATGDSNRLKRNADILTVFLKKTQANQSKRYLN